MGRMGKWDEKKLDDAAIFGNNVDHQQ